MGSFGHWGDAFSELRTIAENGGDLRSWAATAAQWLGEDRNLAAVWPSAAGYAEYFTVDQPHRTVWLRETGNGTMLEDVSGAAYDRFMVRPL